MATDFHICPAEGFASLKISLVFVVIFSSIATTFWANTNFARQIATALLLSKECVIKIQVQNLFAFMNS